MPIDGLAVDVLDVVGEELGDVLVGAPVQWHTQVVAILRFELVLDVLALEQVGTEPVEVGKLLGRQLVELAVRPGRELKADEVLEVQSRIGPLLAGA